MKRYLHISFHFPGIAKTSELEPVFRHLAEDWLRYSENAWIAWTAQPPETWFNAIKPYLGPNDHFVILELKQAQGPLHGWLPTWIWNWLNKVRT